MAVGLLGYGRRLLGVFDAVAEDSHGGFLLTVAGVGGEVVGGMVATGVQSSGGVYYLRLGRSVAGGFGCAAEEGHGVS
jgi:hypothetical protein